VSKKKFFFFAMDRRAFIGAAATAVGLGAAGAAPALASGQPMAVEPDLTDATANAPGYSGQPKRRAKVAVAEDPLEKALRS
jgi:hypothetical protein